MEKASKIAWNIAKGVARTVLPGRVYMGLMYLYRPQRFAYLPHMTYCKDGLATVHNTSHLKESPFSEAYGMVKSEGAFRGSWGEGDPEWRSFVTCWAAKKGAKLEGDFVECGVNKAGFSRAIMRVLGFKKMTDRRFWLLDTYQGTPDSCFDPGENKHHHHYEDCYEYVKGIFANSPNVSVIRGAVPLTLSQVTAKKVAYLSIDMNVTGPEIAAAEFFWDKLVPGAVIVLDDYGWQGHEMQHDAFDEFARLRGVEVLPLPTGQGLLFKNR